VYNVGRIRIGIGIREESLILIRVRVGLKTMPVHNTGKNVIKTTAAPKTKM
jgi:hypothetical protein